MNTVTMRTIHVDIEGGWGGSSRSLYELVRRLPKVGIEPVVLHRQRGPLEDWYAAEGIVTQHLPKLASFLPRERKVLKNLIGSAPRLLNSRSVGEDVAHAVRAFEAQAIHLNYDGLFLLAQSLRRRMSVPLLGHSRAMLPTSVWGAVVSRNYVSNIDHLFCISENELERYKVLAGDLIQENFMEVMWNISRPVRDRSEFASPPEAIYLGSIDWSKGTDILVDVALALKKLNAPPLKLVVYGTARTSPKYEAWLRGQVRDLAIDDRIEFRGYTKDPMFKMSSAFALIRPSRDNAPWGRDVIEATYAGVPVIAAGDFEGVVKHDKTGLLFKPFDPETVANALLHLLRDHDKWRNMSVAARAHGKKMFSGDTQVCQFRNVLERLVVD